MDDWAAHAAREEDRYLDGESRLAAAADADAFQRQLTRMGNAAYGAGLAHLMRRDHASARRWLALAADRYRESVADAPPGSWGRPIGAMKASVLAGDWARAAEEARAALRAGAAGTESPIGRYAAALALLILEDWDGARLHADVIRVHDGFPSEVGDALAMIAAGSDSVGYIDAVERVLDSFEERTEYLEDVPVADTVLVLQELGARRGLVAELSSPLLPG